MPYIYDEILPVVALFIKCLSQGWIFNTPEWKQALTNHQSTIRLLVLEIMEKKYPETFQKSESGTTDNSHASITEEIIRNPKYGSLISQSAILDFEMQKGFMLFYNLAIKNQPSSQVKDIVSLLAGYALSVLSNESVLMLDDMTEKSVLLKIHEQPQSLMDSIKGESVIVPDLMTGSPINVKACMKLCKIILSFNGRSDKSVEITESQLFELAKMDPKNPYIPYFSSIVFEKKAKLLMRDMEKNARKVEESCKKALEQVEKVEDLLIKSQLNSKYSSIFLTPLRFSSIYSVLIDVYLRSNETLPLVQTCSDKMVIKMDQLEKMFETKPPRLTTGAITNMLFLRTRAYFYTRKHQACCETFEKLFELRYLSESIPIVTSASFYLAGMVMQKKAEDALPKLDQLLKDIPSSLDIKLLQLNAKDFAMENKFIDEKVFQEMIQNYKNLLDEVEKQKPTNAKQLQSKISLRLQVLENRATQKR